jgi:hypothetical protein
MQVNLDALRVRPVSGSEETRYRELMQQHHYLGDLAKIGHTLWYVVATHGEEWAALLSFSAAAWKCGVRDRWIGWGFRHQYDRLSLTRGFRRTREGYSARADSPKLVFVRPVQRNARGLLSHPILDPVACVARCRSAV